jgi:cytochrome c-type biogenesis protein CcmH/NrfG
MNPMKRLLSLVATALLAFSFASCKSASSNSESANNAQPNAASAAEFTPPPGAEEISEDRFRKDARQNPDDPTPHFNLGNIYLAEGKFDEAADEL